VIEKMADAIRRRSRRIWLHDEENEFHEMMQKGGDIQVDHSIIISTKEHISTVVNKSLVKRDLGQVPR